MSDRETVYECDNPKLTARRVAMKFADTFTPRRPIEWQADGRFHFENGLKVYEVHAKPNGWRIVVVGMLPWELSEAKR